MLVLVCVTVLVQPATAAVRAGICLGCHGAPTAERAGAVEARKAAFVDELVLRSSVHSDLECADCHRDARTVPHAKRLSPVDCTRCHYVQPLPPLGVAEQAVSGLHERTADRGKLRSPACRDCHGDHNIRSPLNPPSLVSGTRAPATCGTCHEKARHDYEQSVHGTALQAGDRSVPSCPDCHVEHPRDAGRLPDVARGGVIATCIACHDDPGLQRRYALAGERFATYLGTYHGAATALGSSRMANCASCHEAHLILPSSDPRSSVNHANLPHTCGHCHPGAGANFPIGTVHLRPSPTQDRAVFWVKIAYQVFIAGLMLAFLAYIGLDLLARLRRRIAAGHRAARGEAEPEFERLTLAQRIQHWVLIATFLVLMFTGLPVMVPGAELSRSVVTLLGGAGARAIIHRVAALLLIGLTAFHLMYVLFSRRGYWEFRQLIPLPRDLLQLVHMLLFYSGLTETRPRFDRYNYIEKFEYLAVGWGSVVMITTGILLWSPVLTLAALPKWVMDVAVVAHGWEAIMAFLAIIIWHMYNVHFNPSVFPMSRIWLTGKIGLQELRENHPLEYERMIAHDSGNPAETQSPEPTGRSD
ncbi:MAG: cytochrome c3 family protein [Armatimonadota bacterium]|nr:MAG: cytochrome c3 family protein [Armatimonadota bacterium]